VKLLISFLPLALIILLLGTIYVMARRWLRLRDESVIKKVEQHERRIQALEDRQNYYPPGDSHHPRR
jgi:hypothetical protein